MKRVAILGIVATASLSLSAPTAQADLGGNVPGPGLCDYPGVGVGHGDGGLPLLVRLPSRRERQSLALRVRRRRRAGVGGVNVLLFSASVITPVGVLEGSCSFRCPDGSLSAAPNPPGAWKNALTAKKCVPLEVAPVAEPNAALPPWPGQLPGVTNPVTPNPVTTENP